MGFPQALTHLRLAKAHSGQESMHTDYRSSGGGHYMSASLPMIAEGCGQGRKVAEVTSRNGVTRVHLTLLVEHHLQMDLKRMQPDEDKIADKAC